jgi:hypothetical protein
MTTFAHPMKFDPPFTTSDNTTGYHAIMATRGLPAGIRLDSWSSCTPTAGSCNRRRRHKPDPSRRDPRRRCGGIFGADGADEGRDARTARATTREGRQRRVWRNALRYLLMTPLTSIWLSVTACRSPRSIGICEPPPPPWASPFLGVDEKVRAAPQQKAGNGGDSGLISTPQPSARSR